MKSYTVNQLAKLAGVSVRTLHYYDQIGLLKPSFTKANGYRFYGEKELLRLQQILFFRELEFSLEDVKDIVDAPGFDIVLALKDHKKLLAIKVKRLTGLLTTIDNTIDKIKKNIPMDDKDLYGSFSKEEMEKYQAEAKERWGQTEAWRQSEERTKKMGKEGLKKVLEESGKLTLEIASHMGEDPKSEVVQGLIVKHYDGLRAFYEPNVEIYRGLATMYVDDPRFKANYEKVKVGLAEFMRDAMMHYCDVTLQNENEKDQR